MVTGNSTGIRTQGFPSLMSTSLGLWFSDLLKIPTSHSPPHPSHTQNSRPGMHCFRAGSIRLHLRGTLEAGRGACFPWRRALFSNTPSPASACGTESELVNKLCRAAAAAVPCRGVKIFPSSYIAQACGTGWYTWQRNKWSSMITMWEKEFVFYTELTGTGFLCSRPRLSPMLGASAKGKENIVFSREGCVCVCVCVCVLGRGRRGREKQEK